jgi:hypothetical protein
MNFIKILLNLYLIFTTFISILYLKISRPGSRLAAPYTIMEFVLVADPANADHTLLKQLFYR